MSLQLIAANLQAVQQAKILKLHGRDHYVVPITLMREQVLNGSRGPLFYPADEITESVEKWNGIPIVLGHPMDGDGKEISARTPAGLNQWALGVVLNSFYADGALRAEGWFDIGYVKRIAPALALKITRGDTVEISTGLYVKKDETAGVHNEKSYEAIARNHTPDHLAVLLDGQTGACSVIDGCGINNAEVVPSVDSRVAVLLGVANQISHHDLHSKLQKALEQRIGGGYIEDIFDSHIIYQQGNSMYRIGYATDLRTEDGSVTLSGDGPIAVKRVISYKPADSLIGNAEMKLSDEQKAAIVTKLTANCDCWKGEGDAAILNGLPDTKLTQLEKAYDDSVAEPKPPVVNKEEDNKSVPSPKPMTDAEWLAAAPAGIRSVVANSMKMEKERKLQLIGHLTANMDDGDNKTRICSNLSHKSIEELQDLVSLLPPRADDGLLGNNDGGQWVAANASPAYNSQSRKPTESLEIMQTDWEELASSTR